MTAAVTVSPPSTATRAGRGGVVFAAGYVGLGVVGYLVAWAPLGAAACPSSGRPSRSPPGRAMLSGGRTHCRDRRAVGGPALVGPVALYPIFGPVLVARFGRPTALAAALLLGRCFHGDRDREVAARRTGNLPGRRAARPGLERPRSSSRRLVRLRWRAPGRRPTTAASIIAGWVARLLVLAVLLWPPAVAFTVLLRRRRPAGTRPAGEVLADAALLVAAFGPLVTASVLVIPWIYALSLIGFAALLVFAAFRVAVRPLAAISARAAAQRDLAVAPARLNGPASRPTCTTDPSRTCSSWRGAWRRATMPTARAGPGRRRRTSRDVRRPPAAGPR